MKKLSQILVIACALIGQSVVAAALTTNEPATIKCFVDQLKSLTDFGARVRADMAGKAKTRFSQWLFEADPLHPNFPVILYWRPKAADGHTTSKFPKDT